MNILVINSGSSSIKYQLIDMKNNAPIFKGAIERIGLNDGSFKFKYNTIDKKLKVKINTHAEGIEYLLNFITKANPQIVEDISSIDAIGHRVVHGGELFKKAVRVDEHVIAGIKQCIPIAPLHNPANLAGIEACQRLMPNVPQVAVFDTAFHQTIPEKAFIYGLPYELYKKYGVRRYGFHGISHKYVAQQAAREMKTDLRKLKLITCHLGNGASITAIKGGKSIDTSMGFTPLEGVIMGSRSGEIDPAIVSFIMEKEDMTAKQVTKYLNDKSGVLGISGVSSDFRDLESAIKNGNKRAKTAVDVFVYSVQKYIGSYIMALDGVDAIIFTAGLGENSPYIRARIAENLDYLGTYLDKVKNKTCAQAKKISTANSKTQLWVIPTNEELMIAKETKAVLKKTYMLSQCS